jgi:hypothetical protein
MGWLFRSLLVALFSLPALAFAQAGAPLSFSIPEKMINDNLKGQSWAGEGEYDTGFGTVPYTWKLREVSCALKDGYSEIQGVAEVSSSGVSYQEQVKGKVKLRLFEKTQIIRVRLENLLVPIYMPVLGAKKKVGDVDLAVAIGDVEVEAEPFLAQASAFLPAGQQVILKALVIAAGLLKIDVLLKEKEKKEEKPPTSQKL